MKILIVADILGKKNNGTTMAAYNLIDSLIKRGHDVRVLCADKEKKNKDGYFVCDEMNFGPANHYVHANGINPAKADDSVINKALEGVDVVHCMMPFLLGNRTAKLAKLHGIPVTAGFHVQAENVTSHFFLLKASLLNGAIYKVFWHKLYRHTCAIHFPTEFIKHDFEKSVGPTNGFVISNGVKNIFVKKKVEKPDELKDKFCILYTGRYSKEKRQKLLIKACKYSKYGDKIQIIFAGDGPQRKAITKYSKHLKNKPIMGNHSQEELINIINYSDLYVHCAYAELESIACLEAISCGLVPVINNTKRTATKNFALDENNLFKSDSPKDLAKKIDYWIEHPIEKAKRSEEYLDFTKNFEYEHCMDRMEKMMYEAVGIFKYKKEHNIKNRVVTYNDPVNEDYSCNSIVNKKLKDSFKYVHTNIFWRFFAHVLYTAVAKPIVWCIGKLNRGIKVENKYVLKKIRKNGYFLYGNHTSKFDAVIGPAFVATNKKCYTIANSDAVSIKGLKNIVMMLGALPVPSTPTLNEKFLAAIEKRVAQKQVIAIFPEAHIWPYCQVIRPFPETSFIYPAKFNKPVVAMVASFRPQKHDSSLRSKPRITITLSEPIYPNPDLSIKENTKYLHDQVYDFMVNTLSNRKNVDYITYIPCVHDSARFKK